MARLARAARIGDSERGVEMACSFPHCPRPRRGKFTEGSDNVFINGIGALRVGDEGDCNGGHNGRITVVDGSSVVWINGRPAAHVRALTLCQMCSMPGSIVEGSSNVFIG